MQLGMIGLGRMGAGMVRRMMQAGIECVVYDTNPENISSLVADGAIGSSSLEDFVSKLTGPKTAWMMIPTAFVDDLIDQLEPLMGKDDIIVDGGNSYYRDDLRRAKRWLPAKALRNLPKPVKANETMPIKAITTADLLVLGTL